MDDHGVEYHAVTVFTAKPQHQMALSQFTQEGWELVSSTPFGIFGSKMRLTFRRAPMPGQIPPHRVPLNTPGQLKALHWILAIGAFLIMAVFIGLIIVMAGT